VTPGLSTPVPLSEPAVENTVTPRWRPSKVRMTHNRSAVVVPRRGMVALPSLASGAGLALSLPPWGWWIVASPPPACSGGGSAGLRPRTRLLAGFLAGLGCYIPGLMWARAFTVPGAITLMVVESRVHRGRPAWPYRRRRSRPGRWAFPAALTLAEALRTSWPFGGLPIGGVFLGQAGGPLLGAARLGGPLGLTAAVYVGGWGWRHSPKP